MIDLHSHILPSLDDGAHSWEEAISMCQMAWEDGIQIIAATPHFLNGVYDVDVAAITVQCEELRDRLRRENVPIEVVQGAEIYSCVNLPKLLKAESILTLGGGGCYFLLEFPHSIVPPNAEQLIFELALKGLIPVIAHPERNLHIQGDTAILERLVSQGAFCQVTAMSLTGAFGRRAEECVYQLLEKGCVHLVASDAHGTHARPPILSEARRHVLKYAGARRARELFEEFPKKILEEKA
ncbi:MAG: hypothetical protein HY585_05665 [Candidatus Omnitrophica bacterium]|nr:hypothetical protein [Candidatus Omnitrophota bacterium]